MNQVRIRYIGPREEVAAAGRLWKRNDMEGTLIDEEQAKLLLKTPQWYEEVKASIAEQSDDKRKPISSFGDYKKKKK